MTCKYCKAALLGTVATVAGFVGFTAPMVEALAQLPPRQVNAALPDAPLTALAPIPVASRSGLADGTYTGPTVDAYYGLVQVKVSIKGGRLVSIDVLRYPDDRRTSRYINSQALSMLQNEVIQAQSARVYGVSGATLTSRAYLQSVGAALRQAGT